MYVDRNYFIRCNELLFLLFLLVTTCIILKELGQGTFGSVFLAEKETNKKKYALKVINKDFLSRTERTEEALIERLILSKCKHPSIVRLSSSFQTRNKLFFVMEYCPNKDLDVLLRKMGTFDEELALQIISELVNAIDYLHNQMEIAHNDLKPSNILLDNNYHIKLIDFSTARIKNKIFDKKKGDFIPSEDYITKDIIGTAEFISPEMVNQKITDYRTNDIWSLGIIIYMIFNGETPFKGKNDFITIDKVKEGKFEYIKKDIPEDVIDLLNNILIEDTTKRFDIKKVKEHKYVLKMIVLGDVGVGKTLIIRRLLNQENYKLEETVGVEFTYIDIFDADPDNPDIKLTIQIWDTCKFKILILI